MTSVSPSRSGHSTKVTCTGAPHHLDGAQTRRGGGRGARREKAAGQGVSPRPSRRCRSRRSPAAQRYGRPAGGTGPGGAPPPPRPRGQPGRRRRRRCSEWTTVEHLVCYRVAPSCSGLTPAPASAPAPQNAWPFAASSSTRPRFFSPAGSAAGGCCSSPRMPRSAGVSSQSFPANSPPPSRRRAERRGGAPAWRWSM